MSDSTKPAEGSQGQSADQYKNLKAEMDRKITNQEQSIQQLLKSQETLLAQLSKLTTPTAKQPVAEDSDNIEDLWYSKPEVAAKKIEERTEKKIMEKIEQQNASVQQRNSVLSQLVSEYPELNNQTSDLTKKAVEIYSTLPEDEKSRPMAYRLAVKEAAAELGVKPISKRENQDEFYTMGGSSGSATTGTSSRKSKDELDDATATFAQIMGVDLNKVKERAKSRKSWTKYE